MKLVASYKHCRAKYREFRFILINLQRHLQTCLARHKQLATNAVDECWRKEENGDPSRAALEKYELASIELTFCEKRLYSEREDGSFSRNAKNLFTLIILHDPLIHKIILKMQQQVIQDTDP